MKTIDGFSIELKGVVEDDLCSKCKHRAPFKGHKFCTWQENIVQGDVAECKRFVATDPGKMCFNCIHWTSTGYDTTGKLILQGNCQYDSIPGHQTAATDGTVCADFERRE